MKYTTTAFLIALMLFSCSNHKKSEKDLELFYELKEAESGISFEVFADSIIDENRYNYNNKILIPGRSFIYELDIEAKDGQKKYFRKYKEDSKAKWEFVDANHPDAIKKVIIGVQAGNAMEEWVPGYNQTNLSYKLGNENTFNMSGGVENKANLWIHPPRDNFLKILELNPFPYIKAPYEVGTQWTWKLLIGGHYGDPNWKEWEGNIENNYIYKITDEIKLNSKIGNLDCLVIESKAMSELGDTYLTSYFNKDYGFVKLDYNNIDGSKTVLELIEVKE